MRTSLMMGMLIGVVVNLSGQLPTDIVPDSMSRLPLVKRGDLDENGQRVFDLISGPNRTGRLSGPAALSLYSPHAAEPLEMLNRWLRANGVLGPRLTELAILVAARELDQQYEWSGHEPAAVRAGVDPAVIDVIRFNKDYSGLDPKDAVIIRLGRQLFRQRRVDSDLFAKAVELFGRQGTITPWWASCSKRSISIRLRSGNPRCHRWLEWVLRLANQANSRAPSRVLPSFPRMLILFRSAVSHQSSVKTWMQMAREFGISSWAAIRRPHSSVRLGSRSTAPVLRSRCTI
jgi:4-carboxymuconolactone decarboxylase